MKHYFAGILRRIYKPSKKFFIKSPYPYRSKCTDPKKKCFNQNISSWRKPTFSSVLHWLSFEPDYEKIEALFFWENDQKNHIPSFRWKFQILPWESLDNENKRLLKKNHENRLIDEAKHNFLRIDFGTFLVPVELICAIKILFWFS
jgi:hypothetical protein